MSSQTSFQSLSDQYNTILTQYKQTYQNYIQSLDSSGGHLVTVPGASFWGNAEISHIQVSKIDDCLNECATTSSCSGATYNNNTQQCYLRQGKGNIIPSTSGESAIVSKSLQYSYQLKNMNQQLIDLNQQIMDQLNKSYNDQKPQMKQQQNKQIQLTQNNTILQEDRETIGEMIRHYELLNAADENSQLVVTQQYSKYIVYLLVAILLIALLIKFSVFNGEQRGGGNRQKYYFQTFFMLLGIYFFGFSILQYFQKVNEYSMLLLFMILYLVINIQGLC